MYAVLFDIDGTLLQSGGAGSAAFGETFCEVFQLTDFPEGITFAGRSDRAIAQEIMHRSGIEPSVANWQRFYTDYCGRIADVLAVNSGTVLPGVVELLDQLAADEHTALGLLTGKYRLWCSSQNRRLRIDGAFCFWRLRRRANRPR